MFHKQAELDQLHLISFCSEDCLQWEALGPSVSVSQELENGSFRTCRHAGIPVKEEPDVI